MTWLGQPVLKSVGIADPVETHAPGIDRVSVSRLLGELDAPRHCLSDQWRSNGSIGQDRVDVTGNGVEQLLKELPGCFAVCFVYGVRDRKPAGPVPLVL